jgi:hypothetical protein
MINLERGGEVGLRLCKWTLLLKLSLDTPCLQPEGLETSSPWLSHKMGITGGIDC